jgi:hypothetical protein
MTMGTGLVLLAVGAILRYAINDDIKDVDLQTVGLILMIVGAIAFVVGAIYAFGRRRDAPPRRGRRPARPGRPALLGSRGAVRAYWASVSVPWPRA